MWYFTKVADWWTEQQRRSELSLEAFVEQHPNQFGIIVATAVHTSMELGSGVVDVLRLGDGIGQGGVKGWATDGLRWFAFAGSLGKGVQMMRSGAGAKLARAILDPGGGICSWVNSTKALVHTGQKLGGKLFVAVEDLARAAGVPFHQLGGIPLDDMIATLRRLGAKVKSVQNVSELSAALKLLPRNGSVLLISVKVIQQGRVAGGHAMYLFYDVLGRLRVMDRTGIYDSLSAVAKRYEAERFDIRAAALLENVYAKFFGPKGSATLAVEALAVVAREKAE